MLLNSLKTFPLNNVPNVVKKLKNNMSVMEILVTTATVYD
jgi:hypothetical protein